MWDLCGVWQFLDAVCFPFGALQAMANCIAQRAQQGIGIHMGIAFDDKTDSERMAGAIIGQQYR